MITAKEWAIKELLEPAIRINDPTGRPTSVVYNMIMRYRVPISLQRWIWVTKLPMIPSHS